jgi:hypothetical protein
MVESLIIIDAGTLCESVKNSVSLVPLKCPVALELVLEYPLIDDNIGAAGAWNQVPSVIGHESGVLFLHNRPPIRIGEGGPN